MERIINIEDSVIKHSHQDTVSHILVVHHVTFIKFLKTGEILIGICEGDYDKVFE